MIHTFKYTRWQESGDWFHSWDVGYYKPDGEFETLLQYDSKAHATLAVNFLNGGSGHLPEEDAAV